MRPVSVLVGVVLLAVGCKKDRSEIAPAVSDAPVKVAVAPSANATGEEMCSQKSICPNEPIDEEGNALCAELARDPICGAKFRALVRCQIAKEKCGADGKIDQTATLDLCKLEDSALNECNQAKAAAPK
jgi:hypothetical protein